MSYFLLYGAFALWVLFDCISRKTRAVAALWVLGTAMFGPVILPIYLAFRPLKKGEVREGGKAWNVLKNFAILWTIVMVMATIATLTRVANITTSLTSDAEKAGAGIGMLVGMTLLGAVWFFPTMGAALVGFLLKKNTIVETGPTGPLVGQESTASAASGWAGVGGVAVLGLLAVGVANVPKGQPAGPTNGQSARSSLPSTESESEWTVHESTNKMDDMPVVALLKSGTNGATLTIRCSENTTAAFVNTDTVVDGGSVRVRLDASVPLRQEWTRSTDYKALFAPDAITFARQLTKARDFIFEFTQFQEGPRTVTFDVSNLDAKLKKVADACDWDAWDAADRSRARARARAKAENEALRERVAQYVHPCKERERMGQWCWNDPNSASFGIDKGGWNTREEALQDALQDAK